MTDIPSAVTDAEAETLRRLAFGGAVLEVGSLLGRSTVALAGVAASVLSVDPHDGYPENDPRPTLQPFLENLERAGVRSNVTVCVATAQQALPFLRPQQFDLAFVDCTGHYDVTLAIAELAMPLLRFDGVLCIHDFAHPQWPDVSRVVYDLDHNYWVVDRMAVLQGPWHKPLRIAS